MRLDSLEIHSRGSPQTRGNARGLVARLPRKRDNARNTALHGHFFPSSRRNRRISRYGAYQTGVYLGRFAVTTNGGNRKVASRGWRKEVGQKEREREKKKRKRTPRRVGERERAGGGRGSAISLLLSKFLRGPNGGSRRVATPLARAREHSFFGDEEGYRARSRSRSFGRGCSGVRNEIYEGPLFRHLEETAEGAAGAARRMGREGQKGVGGAST